MQDIQFWHTSDGQISVSTERFKHGTSSLKWEWSSSSALTYNNPKAFRSIKWANNICFAFWLYSEHVPQFDENNPQQPLYIEFLTATDPEPVERIWYHVNFHGWRPLGLRFALLPKFKTSLSQVAGIRIYPPSNIPNGVYYINGMTFDYKHTIGPQEDYQQPWATPDNIQRLSDDPSKWLFNPNNIFYNRPWLQEQDVHPTDDDVKKLKDRWLGNLIYGTW